MRRFTILILPTQRRGRMGESLGFSSLGSFGLGRVGGVRVAGVVFLDVHCTSTLSQRKCPSCG